MNRGLRADGSIVCYRSDTTDILGDRSWKIQQGPVPRLAWLLLLPQPKCSEDSQRTTEDDISHVS